MRRAVELRTPGAFLITSPCHRRLHKPILLALPYLQPAAVFERNAPTKRSGL